MAFWRRSKGRHALGAAVTSIPAAPRAAAPVPVPPVPPALPTSPPAVPAQAPAPVADWAPAPVSEWSFPELVPPAPEPAPVGPRVELTFRIKDFTALIA